MSKMDRGILIITSFALLLILVLLFLLWKRDKIPTQSNTVTMKNTIETPKDAVASYDKNEKKVVIKSDKLNNSSTNTNSIRYYVKLKSDMSVLYESDYINPGQSLEAISFSVDLPPGTYDVFLDVESYNETTNVGGQMYSMQIIIE